MENLTKILKVWLDNFHLLSSFKAAHSSQPNGMLLFVLILAIGQDLVF